MKACISVLLETTFEVAALGRPLFPGMLYDSRTDGFIPGVTLWDKTSLYNNLDTRTDTKTDIKFSAFDSLNSKCSLLDVSASLKASFMSGLVEVEGSANYLLDTKSSNQQSRVTMYYSETTKFEQLTMTQLGHITYPQVFHQKTATHVVTAVLYGARAIMVFDRTFSEYENKQDIHGELKVMVSKISAGGYGAINMTDNEKKISESIRCTFHGDFHLERNPTTYMEALQVYKQLPTQLKINPQNVVPLKVWLYPLHLLDPQSARLVTEMSTSTLFDTEAAIDELGDAERICNDLLNNPLVNVFSDIEERLHSFQRSFIVYKMALQRALGKVLPSIRGGEKEQSSVVDILRNHSNSPFRNSMQWLHNTMSELHRLSFCTKELNGIRTVDSDGLNNILLNPNIDIVVCFALTSLKYEDKYLLSLSAFVKSEEFTKFTGTKTDFLLDEVSDSKWLNNQDVIIKMRENLRLFKSFSEANKDNKKMHFIISAISDASNPGSSIYLYEQGNLTDKQFKPSVSKPPAPIVKRISEDSVSLILQKSPAGETVQYRVEYKEEETEKEEWMFKNTADEHFTLTGLKSAKQYLIRYRTMVASEASDTAKLYSLGLSVVVGGKGGDAFNVINNFENTLQKISISFSDSVFHTIQMTFNGGEAFDFGNVKGFSTKYSVFDQDDKITAATVWPNDRNTRVAGLEFEVTKSNGERRKFSVKGRELGDPVSLDVRSGRCYGAKGRSGDEIDALGFYFF
ncbi:putative verrucotoxin subunit beta-like [Triplophysa rosa]|uniref:Verrucotoxin subunit beta-like n=1 Tax=Triplophysa rosa TaxID=992332 RepID=A0A9W7TSV1_TRIRA|nr:putative verrucotoxin subunit beta-like [Triplophysa rosa]